MNKFPVNITSANAMHTARTVGIGALRGYRGVLKTKLLATDMAIKGLEKVGAKPQLIEIKKENENMNKFLSTAAILAVTGAALGAVGYYLYKKEKELSDYEDLLFTQEYMDEYQTQAPMQTQEPLDCEHQPNETCCCEPPEEQPQQKAVPQPELFGEE